MTRVPLFVRRLLLITGQGGGFCEPPLTQRDDEHWHITSFGLWVSRYLIIWTPSLLAAASCFSWLYRWNLLCPLVAILLLFFFYKKLDDHSFLLPTCSRGISSPTLPQPNFWEERHSAHRVILVIPLVTPKGGARPCFLYRHGDVLPNKTHRVSELIQKLFSGWPVLAEFAFSITRSAVPFSSAMIGQNNTERRKAKESSNPFQPVCHQTLLEILIKSLFCETAQTSNVSM